MAAPARKKLIAFVISVLVMRSAIGQIAFEETTSAAGIDHVGTSFGASWGDFDNDGDQDLLMVDGAQSGQGSDANEFLVNTNGVLEDRAVEFGLDYPFGGGRTPLWFDWNNDGRLDVFLANTLRFDGPGESTALTQSATGGFVIEDSAMWPVADSLSDR